ncbi:SIS domain-containing protein [Prosthecobacter sp.]|jgi:N-acetylmuramic acid 6-phosphate etherase|uniref:SIS domain-containing protein n=1 Tax=Prosthecobacter sp. TaxID=1965333 RepID=UPI00378376B2
MSPADEFLKVAPDYQLGSLDTESQHPFTLSLSQMAREDLPEAIKLMHQVDVHALRQMQAKAAPLADLARAVAATFEAGKRVFLCGCGATGRLSLSIEIFCRMGVLPCPDPERVVAFMAGGDLALIKAIENFEDHPEYGARQLEELGFTQGDLLISSTEGGETPFVIGATERAAELSSNQPWFLYCNPDEQLIKAAARSKRVIENPLIHKLNLAVGAMAVAGSTRMQASTVLMAAIGFAFMHQRDPEHAPAEVLQLMRHVAHCDGQFLAPFIEREAAVYERGAFVLYESGRFGITVVTDTTERAPTFSLAAFEKQDDPAAPASWCHFIMPEQPGAHAAWKALLHRDPRTLDWPDVRHVAGAEVLACYDFSAQLLARRQIRTHNAEHHRFRIGGGVGEMMWEFDDLRARVDLAGVHEFHAHLLLKMLINIHSTLVMGRLGRYLDNLMTFVKPSNNKLIDRSVRYVRLLAQRRTGTLPAYEKVTLVLFDEREKLKPGEPIVLKTLAALGVTV